jgi:hypothetical protein
MITPIRTLILILPTFLYVNDVPGWWLLLVPAFSVLITPPNQ